MPYTKTVWVNGGAPPISAANLNNLETQYDEAVAQIPIFTELTGTYTEKSITNFDVWEDWDISGIVPVGTIYAEVMVTHISAATRYAGVRKNGSALERKYYCQGYFCFTTMVAVDANRIIEIFSSTENNNFYYAIKGYWKPA